MQVREPELADFIELVKHKTLLVNNLLFSKSPNDQYCERSSKDLQQNPKHKRNKLTTYVTVEDSSKTTGLELCVVCQKKHPLDKFESIMGKPLNERIKILRKRKLCYGCLKPMTKDHNAKNCLQRLTCRICVACHPIILHGYVPKVKTDSNQKTANPECFSRNAAEEENLMCASVNGKFHDEVINIFVVPIKISRQNFKRLSGLMLCWITVVREVSSNKI